MRSVHKSNQTNGKYRWYILAHNTDAGQVSRVDCEKVENITIEGSTVEGEKCLDLLPIKIPSGNETFLRKDGILLKHYEGMKCPSQDQYFDLNDLEINFSSKRLFTFFRWWFNILMYFLAKRLANIDKKNRKEVAEFSGCLQNYLES